MRGEAIRLDGVVIGVADVCGIQSYPGRFEIKASRVILDGSRLPLPDGPVRTVDTTSWDLKVGDEKGMRFESWKVGAFKDGSHLLENVVFRRDQEE